MILSKTLSNIVKIDNMEPSLLIKKENNGVSLILVSYQNTDYLSGDVIFLASTFYDGAELGDFLLYKGVTFEIITKGKGYTIDNHTVYILGLKYEKDYDHDQSIVKRYK